VSNIHSSQGTEVTKIVSFDVVAISWFHVLALC
jgi:hypothetical protein